MLWLICRHREIGTSTYMKVMLKKNLLLTLLFTMQSLNLQKCWELWKKSGNFSIFYYIKVTEIHKKKFMPREEGKKLKFVSAFNTILLDKEMAWGKKAWNCTYVIYEWSLRSPSVHSTIMVPLEQLKTRTVYVFLPLISSMRKSTFSYGSGLWQLVFGLESIFLSEFCPCSVHVSDYWNLGKAVEGLGTI